jgi:aminoglycoside 6'-N-acetyltransferase
MKIEKGMLCLRTLQPEGDDFKTIYRWLTDERILQYFDGRDRVRSHADIQAEFAPNSYDGPLMILHEHRPVGFLDIFPFTDDQKTRHGIAEALDPVWAFDIVIGEVNSQNKGIGRQAVGMVLQIFFESLHAQRVVLDTYTLNARAIRCYERCGFTITRMLYNHELYEGAPAADVFMEIDRKTYYSRYVGIRENE